MPNYPKLLSFLPTVYQRTCCWVTGYALRPCRCISSPTHFTSRALHPPSAVLFSTLSSCSIGLSHRGDRTENNLAGVATPPEPHHRPMASASIGAYLPAAFCASAQKVIQTQTTIRPPEQMRHVLLQRAPRSQSQTARKDRIQSRPTRARRPSRLGLTRQRRG